MLVLQVALLAAVMLSVVILTLDHHLLLSQW